MASEAGCTRNAEAWVLSGSTLVFPDFPLKYWWFDGRSKTKLLS